MSAKVAVVILIVCLALAGAGVVAINKFPELRLHIRLRQLAGWNATNCGILKPGSNANESNTCVLKAYTDQKPFFVVYDTQENRTDTTLIDAMASDKSGNLYDLEYVSRRWHSQDLPAAAKMSDDRFVFIEICPTPITINKSIYKGLTCSPRIRLR